MTRGEADSAWSETITAMLKEAIEFTRRRQMTRGEAIKYLVENPDAVLLDRNGDEIHWHDGPRYESGEHSAMPAPPYTVVRRQRRWKRHGGRGAWVECTYQESREAHNGVAFGAHEARLTGGFQPLTFFPGYAPSLLSVSSDHVWVKWEPLDQGDEPR